MLESTKDMSEDAVFTRHSRREMLTLSEGIVIKTEMKPALLGLLKNVEAQP